MDEGYGGFQIGRNLATDRTLDEERSKVSKYLHSSGFSIKEKSIFDVSFDSDTSRDMSPYVSNRPRSPIYSGTHSSRIPHRSIFIDGTASGIGTGGWMRVEYAADKFTEAAPWAGTGDADISDGSPYSGDFQFVQTEDQIQAMKASATEIRQTFQSFGYLSVGWTYGTGTHIGCKTVDGSTWIGAGDPSIPSNTDYSFLGWDAAGVLEPRGTDPTDANDGVWRESLIYLVETGATYLPIMGIYAQDVDAASEKRYFR